MKNIIYFSISILTAIPTAHADSIDSLNTSTIYGVTFYSFANNKYHTCDIDINKYYRDNSGPTTYADFNMPITNDIDCGAGTTDEDKVIILDVKKQ